MCINIGLNIGIETAVIPLNSNILGENVFEKTKINFFVKHKRGLSILLVYLVLTLLIFVAFTFIVPSVSESLKELINNIIVLLNNPTIQQI